LRLVLAEMEGWVERAGCVLVDGERAMEQAGKL